MLNKMLQLNFTNNSKKFLPSGLRLEKKRISCYNI